jgi:small ligand-binding sensory domain FIST
MVNNTSQFCAASASGTEWQTIVDACLESLGKPPADANLGFVYITDALAPWLENILQYLRKHTGVSTWTGSVGSGICATAQEYYDEPAMSVMLTNLPPDSFRTMPAGIAELSDMLTDSSQWLKLHNVHFGVVHGDPRNRYLPQVIDSLSTQLDPGFLVGGLSSADTEQHLQQVAGTIQQDGLSGVLLSSDVPVISSLTQGCIPLEHKHTITRCQGNILAELDNRPALDVFKEDIGEVLSRNLGRVAGYIFAALPIPGSDTGDYLVRNLIGIDPEEKLLAIGDNLEEDAQLMFCRRDSDAAREDMQRMLADLARRSKGNIRGGLYFSCLGRGRNQFGADSNELKMIRDQLGDFPLVGFFANGEISHNRLYGYTGVLTLFV